MATIADLKIFIENDTHLCFLTRGVQVDEDDADRRVYIEYEIPVAGDSKPLPTVESGHCCVEYNFFADPDCVSATILSDEHARILLDVIVDFVKMYGKPADPSNHEHDITPRTW